MIALVAGGTRNCSKKGKGGGSAQRQETSSKTFFAHLFSCELQDSSEWRLFWDTETASQKEGKLHLREEEGTNKK